MPIFRKGKLRIHDSKSLPSWLLLTWWPDSEALTTVPHLRPTHLMEQFSFLNTIPYVLIAMVYVLIESSSIDVYGFHSREIKAIFLPVWHSTKSVSILNMYVLLENSNTELRLCEKQLSGFLNDTE